MKMEREDNFSTLLRMACSRMDTVDAGFEERIMLEMMNRVVTKTRRRNKVSLVLSLCSAAAIFACSVFLIMHFLPARIFVSKSLNIDTLIDKLPVVSITTPVVEWLGNGGMLPLILLSGALAVMVWLCWLMSRTYYK